MHSVNIKKKYFPYFVFSRQAKALFKCFDNFDMYAPGRWLFTFVEVYLRRGREELVDSEIV